MFYKTVLFCFYLSNTYGCGVDSCGYSMHHWDLLRQEWKHHGVHGHVAIYLTLTLKYYIVANLDLCIEYLTSEMELGTLNPAYTVCVGQYTIHF